MVWTVDKIEKLRQLWGKGNTANQIAQIIGDVTRNAVIGKANRLNLSNKLSPKSTINNSNNFHKKKPTNIPKGKKVKFKSLIIDKNYEPAKNLTLEQLTDDTCKYMELNVHPDQPNATFCGRKTVIGKSGNKFSYCPLHLMIIFQKPKDKKDDLINKEDSVPQFIEKKIKSA